MQILYYNNADKPGFDIYILTNVLRLLIVSKCEGLFSLFPRIQKLLSCS